MFDLLWIVAAFAGGLLTGWLFIKRPKFVDDFMLRHWPTYKID